MVTEKKDKVSKAQQAAVHRYVKANYDRMELTTPKGMREIIRAAAKDQKISANAYIMGLVSQDLKSKGYIDGEE